jgi:hypothetical protein
MKVVIIPGRGNLQLDVEFESRCGPGIPHITGLFLRNVGRERKRKNDIGSSCPQARNGRPAACS